MIGFAFAALPACSAARVIRRRPRQRAQPVTNPEVACEFRAESAARRSHFHLTEDNPGSLHAGPYEIKQSSEFGGRITSYTGNTGTWDSYVNLGSGPRLLEYTIDLHSTESQRLAIR